MPDKRLPERTPGSATLPPDPGDDFTIPATLYIDAIQFLKESIEALARQSDEDSKRYLRAALYSGFAAFEAQLNQAAYAHAYSHAAQLQGVTLDVLKGSHLTY
jgi:hypothetical protein